MQQDTQKTLQPEQQVNLPKKELRKKLWKEIGIWSGAIATFIFLARDRKENWIGYVFLLFVAAVIILTFFRHQIRKGTLKRSTALAVAGGGLAVMLIYAYSDHIASPEGNGYFYQSSGGWASYSFGNQSDRSEDFLDYHRQYLDAFGNPSGHLRRTGRFTFRSKTINCSFDDGRPPYALKFKKVDGEWTVIGENEEVFHLDDPQKRMSELQ